MSNHLNKDIFTESGCISREKILLYKEGLLRRSDMHAVERHLVDCQLCSEALEGLELVPNPSVLHELSNRFSNQNEKPKSDFRNYWAIAATLAGIALLTYFAVDQFNSIQTNQQALDSSSKVKTEKQAPTTAQVQEAQEVQNQKGPTPQGPTPIVKTTKPLQKITEDNNYQIEAVAEYPNEEMTAKAESQDDLAAGSLYESHTSSPAVANVDTEKGLVGQNDAIRPIEPDVAKNKKTKEVKTTSEQEGRAPVFVEATTNKSESTYYSSNIESQLLLYNKGKYEEAIVGFNKILKVDPKNESALFHKGMCLYHLKRFQEALDILQPVSESPGSSYMEAAEFQTALCLEELGKKDRARSTYERIIQNAGPFKDRATSNVRALE
jgi:TolA-binding protein